MINQLHIKLVSFWKGKTKQNYINFIEFSLKTYFYLAKPSFELQDPEENDLQE